MLVFWLRLYHSGNILERSVDGGGLEMSESEGQRSDSPLLSERGATTISDTVVSSIAGMAAQEVEGVHMGGGGSRTASGVIGNLTGSEGKTGGISVEVGTTEAAIDLKMGIEYGRNILQTVEEVRRRITERVEGLTGLRIKELNATITDITFPEKEEGRRLGSGSATQERGDSPEDEATQTMPESETSEPTERETAQAESPSQASAESTVAPEEEAGAEDRPPEARETTEVRSGDAETSEEPPGETPEADTRTEPSEAAATRADNETSEREDAEARMRRRAEERARRRRRRTEGG
jgi:uncharacterized alkaline shock family protein YloU